MGAPPAVTGDMAETPVTVIILAGQRSGVVNPLAQAAGVSHKCLAPICGRPLIAHVLDTITALPAIARIRIAVESEVHAELGALLRAWEAKGIPIELVAGKANIVDSTIAAAGEDAGPFIITTADNVLLTREGFTLMRQALRAADAAIGVTTRERILAIHEAGQRNFYRFRDGAYANCNIYAIGNRKALAATEIFREGGQFQKNPGRMLRAFGPLNVMLMRLGIATLAGGLARVSRQFGLRIVPVIFEDGALAIDVDNERTYRICEWVLGQRLGLDIPKPVIDSAA